MYAAAQVLLLLFVPVVVFDCRRTLAAASAGKTGGCFSTIFRRRAETAGGLAEGVIANFAKDAYAPRLLSAPLVPLVLLGFGALCGALAWRGFARTSAGLAVSDFTNVGSYQRDFALVLEREFTLYPGYLFVDTRAMSNPATQRVQLEAVAALMHNPWLASALPMDSTYWLGTGPASLLALYNSSGPGTPMPADAFYVTLDVWLLGLGAPSAPDLWCYDNTTGMAADCFDRLPPAANKNILIGAVRGAFSLIGQTTTQTYIDAIQSTRASVDGVAAASEATAAAIAGTASGRSDSVFRMFVGGTTYLYYDQYIHIWTDLYRIVGFSLVGVFGVTLIYEPDLRLAAIICAMILMVDLEVISRNSRLP